VALALFAAASLPFVIAPQLDLAVSRAFVGNDGHFIGADSVALAAVMDAITHGSRIFAGALLLATLGAWLPWGGVPAGLRRRRRGLLYLLAVLALGPGLAVNTILKEHSGRARPVTIREFGGERRFTPAFAIADQCASNCSFVSGHVAFAALPLAGAFLAARRRRRRQWLVGGVAAGLLVGAGRIATGAHFASDVVVAIFVVYIVADVCAAWLLPSACSTDQAVQDSAQHR
jgi:lipid A 4'-phosphatase